MGLSENQYSIVLGLVRTIMCQSRCTCMWISIQYYINHVNTHVLYIMYIIMGFSSILP